MSEKQAKDFWFYAKLWRQKKDLMALSALLDMRENPLLSPKIRSRIDEIENEEVASRSLRGSPISHRP